jgi:hypothetical protein
MVLYYDTDDRIILKNAVESNVKIILLTSEDKNISLVV